MNKRNENNENSENQDEISTLISNDQSFDANYDENLFSVLAGAQVPKIKSLEEIKKKTDIPSEDRRSNSRFLFDADVVIIGNLSSFRTKSLDISTSGVLLSNLLPEDFVGKSFEVVIIFTDEKTKTKSYFHFVGESLGGRLRTPRIRFSKASTGGSIQKLECFLSQRQSLLTA